jgi:cbb3-type cytochrome oxidase subunit 1
VPAMNRLDLKFLLLGAIMLTVGVTLGVVMGIRHDFALAPVHAHINLVGWASLSLFGIVYKLYPEMAQSRLAALHFILAAPAALMFPIGIALSIFYDRPLVAIVAALMWLAGTILFLFQITALAFRRAPGFTLAAAE